MIHCKKIIDWKVYASIDKFSFIYKTMHKCVKFIDKFVNLPIYSFFKILFEKEKNSLYKCKKAYQLDIFSISFNLKVIY